jgi:hypothetical protein
MLICIKLVLEKGMSAYQISSFLNLRSKLGFFKKNQGFFVNFGSLFMHVNFGSFIYFDWYYGRTNLLLTENFKDQNNREEIFLIIKLIFFLNLKPKFINE